MGSHPASGGYKYRGLVLWDGGVGVGLTTLPCKKRKLLRSLQEVQPDFEEDAKAYAGLWSQEKKKERKKNNMNFYLTGNHFITYKDIL
jgi:hypothetical protein